MFENVSVCLSVVYLSMFLSLFYVLRKILKTIYPSLKTVEKKQSVYDVNSIILMNYFLMIMELELQELS